MVRLIVLIVSLAAIALALTVAATGPGTRFGLWDFGTGLGLIRTLALPVIVAAGASAVALILSLFAARSMAILALVALVASAAAAYVPVRMKAMVEANPFIHDITTDFENPPEIIAAAALPRSNPPEYVGASPAPRSDLTVAEAQMQAFPDIAPLLLDADLATATDAARDAIAEMGLETLAEGPVSDETGGGWRIEAVATSLWYGFKDDFIVRLSPSPDGGVRVDMRSKSRVGGSDLGANAARVRKFAALMKTKIEGE